MDPTAGNQKAGLVAKDLDIRGSLLAKNTILNLIGMGLPLIIGIVTVPFIIRSLGIERFGVLSLAWVVFAYFGTLDFGLGLATTKFVAECLGRKDYQQIPHYLWTTVFIQLAMGILGALLLILLTPVLVERTFHIPLAVQGEARLTFLFLAVSLPIALITTSFRGLLAAGQRFDLINAVNIPFSMANYLLPVGGLILGFGLSGIVGLLVISRLVAFISWAIMSFRAFPVIGRGISFDRNSVAPLIRFGGWLTVSNIINPLLIYFDRFLIGTVLTMKAVSYYAAPYEVVMRLGIIPTSLIMTLFPTFSALQGQQAQRQTERIFGRAVKFILVSMGPVLVFLVLFSRPIMNRWLGQEFASNSTLIFQILSIGFLINSLARVPSGYLQGIGRTEITAKFHLIEVVVYLPLSWLLISHWGANGAALAWTIRVSMDAVLLFLAVRKIAGISFDSFIENGVHRGLVSLAIFSLGGVLVRKAPWPVGGIAILALGFLALLWLYVISSDEKKWIKECLPKLFLA